MLEALSRAAFDRDVAPLTPRLTERWGWTVLTREHPILDVIFNHASAPLRVQLDCKGWDDQPPSIRLLSIEGAPLRTVPNDGRSIFNPGPHPTTGLPFICMRGSREYHTHYSHTNDPWDNYRGQSGTDLLGILKQLHRVWRRCVTT